MPESKSVIQPKRTPVFPSIDIEVIFPMKKGPPHRGAKSSGNNFVKYEFGRKRCFKPAQPLLLGRFSA